MQKNLSILKRGMVFLLMCLLIAGMAPMAMATAAPQVSITSVTENDGLVVVSGTTENLGNRKVEIIVNEDLDLRYVANEDANGNFVCEFELPYNGDYTVEASIRDYSDFSKIRQVVPNDNYFELEGACTWGSTVVRHTDGLYYMIFSTWDEEKTFGAWSSYSELGYAVSTKREGPYVYQGKTLDPTYGNVTNPEALDWGNGDLITFHNPTLLHSEKDGKYYLYFISHALGETQRIGAAYADSPAGPWTVVDHPVIDIRPDYHDNDYVCNPSVMEVKQENGEYFYYAIYRSNNKTSAAESGYLRASGYATAPTPLGPFTQSDEQIMVNPNADYSVEDCFVWQHNGKYYALAKDMSKGGLTGYTGGYSYALYESTDGVNWPLSENKLAFDNKLTWESGEQRAYARLERAQLYIEDTIPFMMTNAATVNGLTPSTNHTCNIQVPLLGVSMAADTYTLQIGDLQNKKVDKAELQQLVAVAKGASKEYYADVAWWGLYSACRAGEILLARDSAEQCDVDLVVENLKKYLPDQQLDVDYEKINVALNKPVKSSSVYSNTSQGTFPAENAVDGNPNTRWAAQSKVSGKITFEINLMGKYRLDSFEMAQFAPRITKYTWEYHDGTAWIKCYDGTGAADTSTLDGEFAQPVVAERLRLTMLEYTAEPTIWEIDVYGDLLVENISYKKTVSASSNYSATYTATKAVDGDLSTRWSAANAAANTTITYEIDLAGEYNLDSFSMLKLDDRTKEYKWQYYNGTEWKDCFSTTTGEMMGSLTATEPAQKVRVVFPPASKAATFYEFNVFGTPARNNIAQDKPVVASSVYSNTSQGTFPAELAVDGKAKTRWSAKNDVTGTITFEVDLCGSFAIDGFEISQFMLDANDTRITKYSWEYFDGTNWITCYNGVGSIGDYELAGDFVGTEVAQKMRLNIEEYGNPPSIYEVAIYGCTVLCKGISLPDEAEYMVGEFGRLTAEFTPVNTANRKVTWTSSDESVVKVGYDGLIIAVGEGTVNVTVTTEDGGYTDTCTVKVLASGVSIGDTAYETLEEAMDAAKAGDTVKLHSDATVDYLTIDPAVTLDLNGKTLTADYVVGFKGSALIDDNSGKLIIKKDHLALDTANGGYLPVYETDGYIFTTVKLEGRSKFLSATEFAFSPMFETFVHDALLQGAAQSGVSIVIRLNWREEGNYKAEQDFSYLDEMVKKVIGSYDDTKLNYGRAFSAAFEGSEAGQAETVTVTAVVISDTGVEIAGAPATFAEV